MSVGVLAHCFGKLPLFELAGKVGEMGFPYVQLALSKAISDIDCGLNKLSPGLANHVAEAFARKGTAIPVLGCYASWIEPDEEQWRRNVQRFKEHLRHARQFGAAIVATEVGVPQSGTLLEKNRELLDRAVGTLLEEAEKWGVMIGIEPANRHLIDTPAALAELMERFPSSHLGMVLDPCNLLTADNIARQDDVMRSAFDVLGERIVSVHAKDVVPQKEGLGMAAAGTGVLHYSLLMRLVEQHKPYAHVTLEKIGANEMEQAIRFIKRFRD